MVYLFFIGVIAFGSYLYYKNTGRKRLVSTSIVLWGFMMLFTGELTGSQLLGGMFFITLASFVWALLFSLTGEDEDIGKPI
jgi:hypothetical protein